MIDLFPASISTDANVDIIGAKELSDALLVNTGLQELNLNC